MVVGDCVCVLCVIAFVCVRGFVLLSVVLCERVFVWVWLCVWLCVLIRLRLCVVVYVCVCVVCVCVYGCVWLCVVVCSHVQCCVC